MCYGVTSFAGTKAPSDSKMRYGLVLINLGPSDFIKHRKINISTCVVILGRFKIHKVEIKYLVCKIRRPLGGGATRLLGISPILYPGSSVGVRSNCSLDFSYFRCLHPAFFVSLHSCTIDGALCMVESYSILFGYCNRAQEPPNLPPTWRVLRIWDDPRVDLKIYQISSLSPRL